MAVQANSMSMWFVVQRAAVSATVLLDSVNLNDLTIRLSVSAK